MNIIIRARTAMIWSPTWMRPSWSTALSFVMLFTKMPEDSEEEEEEEEERKPSAGTVFWGLRQPGIIT